MVILMEILTPYQKHSPSLLPTGMGAKGTHTRRNDPVGEYGRTYTGWKTYCALTTLITPWIIHSSCQNPFPLFNNFKEGGAGYFLTFVEAMCKKSIPLIIWHSAVRDFPEITCPADFVNYTFCFINKERVIIYILSILRLSTKTFIQIFGLCFFFSKQITIKYKYCNCS